MSQSGSNKSEDPFSPGEQSILPGEQSGGDVVGGSTRGRGSGSGMDDTDGTWEARQANLATFRSSLRAGEMQYDEQVLYDATPDEEASPVYGGMERYEGGEGGGADQDGYNNEMIEEDGANSDDHSNEMSEDDDEAIQEDDDDDQYEVDNASFLALPAQGCSPSDPPSGSEYDGDETHFVARLAGALQQAADNGEVVIADSQAGSDDLDSTSNHAASWTSAKIEEDSQADLDDFGNIPNYAATSGDQEIADWQAGSGDLDNNTANHADPSSDVEVEDSQDDSDDLEINADEAASSSDQEMADSDSDADTIVLSPLNRKRLAPVRTLYNRRIDRDPDSDPESSSSDGDSDSDSPLSELDKTPVPEDPVLRRLEREFKQRTLKRCSCLGWCECTRYSRYYGSWAARGTDGRLLVPSQTHLSEYALSNERFPTSAMRSTIAAEERYEERRERAFSWDRMEKPVLAPVGWVGEEWSEFSENYKPVSVEEGSAASD
jgi:hypothetical protein